MVEKLIPDSFSKIKIENISGSTIWNFIQFLFIVYWIQNILKLRFWPLAFISYKAFLRNRKSSGTSLPASFLHDLWWKVFLTLYSINWTIFIVWSPLLLVIICFPIYDIINFEINFSFLVQSFSMWPKKSGQKNKGLRTKRSFKIK